MREKRGQITLFIIIGILLVALVGVFLFLRSEKIKIQEPEIVPTEFTPVKEYTEKCLEQTLQRAVSLLGQQGGYLYFPESIQYDPSSYISTSPNSLLKVPYWYHKGQGRVPTVEMMQDDISRYINENLKNCIRNFPELSNNFEIKEIGNITTKTTIGMEEVIITTKYPLEVKLKSTGDITKIATFTSSVDTKLRKMHQLAKEIMLSENQAMFLETLTVDMMALGPEIPFSDVVFQCGQLTWYKPDVENKIKNILYYNLPKIRFKNTDHAPFSAQPHVYENLKLYTPEDIEKGNMPKDIPPDAYDYFHFYWKPTEQDYSDLTAGVYFQKDWDFKMYVRPSKGDIMSASYGQGFQKYLSYLCINMFHFTYDLIYPVQIVIVDPSGFGGKGYRFKFAFPVMINHNQGDRVDFPISTYEAPESNDGGYCNEKTQEVIQIYAKNKKTFDDIKGVNITFNCMNTYYCDLGATKPDGGLYRLWTQLPTFCKPGSVEAKHPDYLDESMIIPEGRSFFNIMMTPLKTLDFEVKKQRMVRGAQLEDLEEGEYAVI